MTIKPNDELICYPDLADSSQIIRVTVAKVINKNLFKATDGETYTTDFFFPSRIEKELATIVRERESIKAMLSNSMKLVYELINKLERNEI